MKNFWIFGKNGTLIGKILILKALALPKKAYPAQFLTVPEDILKKINSIFYEFLWEKCERIKQDTLIGDLILCTWPSF